MSSGVPYWATKTVAYSISWWIRGSAKAVSCPQFFCVKHNKKWVVTECVGAAKHSGMSLLVTSEMHLCFLLPNSVDFIALSHPKSSILECKVI